MIKYKKFVYKEQGRTYCVSDSLDAEIRKAIAANKGINTEGRTLYVLYGDPEDDDLRRSNGPLKAPAMVIRDGEPIAVRWYWQQREHKKNHYGCRELGNGMCATRKIRYMVWDSAKKCWALEPMVNRAGEEFKRFLSC